MYIAKNLAFKLERQEKLLLLLQNNQVTLKEQFHGDLQCFVGMHVTTNNQPLVVKRETGVILFIFPLAYFYLSFLQV